MYVKGAGRIASFTPAAAIARARVNLRAIETVHSDPKTLEGVYNEFRAHLGLGPTKSSVEDAVPDFQRGVPFFPENPRGAFGAIQAAIDILDQREQYQALIEQREEYFLSFVLHNSVKKIEHLLYQQPMTLDGLRSVPQFVVGALRAPLINPFIQRTWESKFQGAEQVEAYLKEREKTLSEQGMFSQEGKPERLGKHTALAYAILEEFVVLEPGIELDEDCLGDVVSFISRALRENQPEADGEAPCINELLLLKKIVDASCGEGMWM